MPRRRVIVGYSVGDAKPAKHEMQQEQPLNSEIWCGREAPQNRCAALHHVPRHVANPLVSKAVTA